MVETQTTTQATVVLISGFVLAGCGAALAVIAMIRMGVENRNEKQSKNTHRASSRKR